MKCHACGRFFTYIEFKKYITPKNWWNKKFFENSDFERYSIIRIRDLKIHYSRHSTNYYPYENIHVALPTFGDAARYGG